LNLHGSVLENLLLVGLRNIKAPFYYNYKKYKDEVLPFVKRLAIKTPGLETEAIYLSGGNQQKVVLSKWLYAEQKIYIFDEPTRGIDVNAKADFYKEMTELTKAGNCIIMVSSDMPELISVSDRVLVIRDGRVKCELSGEDINEQTIIREALGVEKNDS
jgi:ribose transport system ATP-binding protein